MKILNSILLLVFFGLTINLSAQDTKVNRAEDPSVEITNAALATELANYGYANKSSLALIEAAKILSEKPLQKLNVEKSEPSTGTEGTKKTKVVNINPANLLVDARTFANKDKTILALVDQVEKTIKTNEANASKGRYYGPAYSERRVYSGTTYTDYILFNGNELAEVLIVGDGDCDLDLYVYDEYGNFITSDTDYSSNCYVSFYPRKTSSYKIVVKNRGNVYSDYILMSN